MPRRACIVGNSGCADGGMALPGTSRCSAHQRSNWGSFNPDHAAVYRGQPWVELRKRVLREEPVCAEPGCSARSTSVDHVISLSDGGAPLERSNVRGMCYEHHKRRSSQQGAEARKRRRATS